MFSYLLLRRPNNSERKKQFCRSLKKYWIFHGNVCLLSPQTSCPPPPSAPSLFLFLSAALIHHTLCARAETLVSLYHELVEPSRCLCFSWKCSIFDFQPAKVQRLRWAAQPCFWCTRSLSKFHSDRRFLLKTKKKEEWRSKKLRGKERRRNLSHWRKNERYAGVFGFSLFPRG